MEKQTITFSANEQTLIKTGGTCNYSSNKVAYIEARFDLGTNWSGYDSIRAIWYNSYRTVSTVLDSLGNCIVPYEVLTRRGKVLVNLVGSIVEDDELTDRITSYPVIALIVDADAKVNGDTAQPITPSEYEQFVAAVGADADRAEQSATNSANSASDSEASAVRAEQARDEAIDSAGESAGYADDASDSARQASASADSASEYAGQAQDARDDILNMTAEATTLPAGSDATASYLDGVMSFGIPKGDKGDKGDKGNKGDTGATGATGNGIASITKTGTSGLIDTYTITFTNGNTTTFDVTNGNGIVSVTLTDTSGLTKTYTITFTDGSTTTFMVQDGQVTEASLIDVLTQYALDTGKYFTDTEPYQFRTAPSGDYNREADTVVGGSVAWNQLCNSSSVTVQSGHKYYLKKGSAYSIGASAGSAITGLTSGSDMVIDLTLALGSTIADYIYTLEQGTAGAGVAWFKRLFPKPYYPYDAGSLQSVSGVSAHKMTGFNQWDGTYENSKWIDNYTTGAVANANSSYNVTDFIRVTPNTAYYMAQTGSSRNIFYDAEKNAIPMTSWAISDSAKVITSPANAHYIRFTITNAYLSAFIFNLSWDGSRNGEYEPYISHSYPLDDTLTLRGVPKLNASNQLYYDGDTYESDGTVTRRYGIRAYQSGDENLADAITDKTNTVYKLTTPTTEQAEPYQNPQIADPSGTEEYVTTSIVPVGHETEYPTDLLGKLEQLSDIPEPPSTNGTYTLEAVVSGGQVTYIWS